jgi:hypothetical protein
MFAPNAVFGFALWPRVERERRGWQMQVVDAVSGRRTRAATKWLITYIGLATLIDCYDWALCWERLGSAGSSVLTNSGRSSLSATSPRAFLHGLWYMLLIAMGVGGYHARSCPF